MDYLDSWAAFRSKSWRMSNGTGDGYDTSTESGECTCDEICASGETPLCECACDNCEGEYVATSCACGGNCSCQDNNFDYREELGGTVL